MRIRKENYQIYADAHFRQHHIPTISCNFLNFPTIFKINQFVGPSETWDRNFESKTRIDAFVVFM